MTDRERLIELKTASGMNWTKFAAYFEIPYRTVQDWVHGKRTMPHYLLVLMEYRLKMEAYIREQELECPDFAGAVGSATAGTVSGAAAGTVAGETEE